MSQVVDRRWKRGPNRSRTRTSYNGPSPWQARWRDPDGRQRSKVFRRKTDAEKFLASIEHRKYTGEYVDPHAGKVTVRTYAEQWRTRQVHRPSTRVSVEHRLRRHIYPQFSDREMRSIRPSEVQAWVTELSTSLEPATVTGIYRMLRTIFNDATRDRIIGQNPCDGVKLPRADRKKLTPPLLEDVHLLAGNIDDRYEVTVWLAAGAGLRLGEVLGLEVQHVDFLRRTIRVEQQLLTEPGGTRIGPPKTGSSIRTIPVSDAVLAEMAEHIRRFPPIEGRILSNRLDSPVRANGFQRSWSRATKRAGVEGVRFHDLRHFFASALIASGASVVAVQNALGHASAKETLDTYGHLWPTDDDRTREAMQSVLSPTECATNVQQAVRSSA